MLALFEITWIAAVEILAANIPESVGIFVVGFGMAALAVTFRRFKPAAAPSDGTEAEQN